MFNIVFWWAMSTVVLFAVAVCGLRVAWNVAKLGAVVAFACAVLLIAGCAAQDRTPEEIAWRNQIDAENWELCSQVLQKHGRFTIHRDHTHDKRGRVQGVPTTWAIRLDLSDNMCSRVLGEYWVEY
jgi:hypothetical protein